MNIDFSDKELRTYIGFWFMCCLTNGLVWDFAGIGFWFGILAYLAITPIIFVCVLIIYLIKS